MIEDSESFPKMEEPVCYRIRVQGKLDPDWLAWFGVLTMELESEKPAVSSLIAEVADQASLRGLLNSIWDLNLNLISLSRVEKTSIRLSEDA
jgi:hypothetical protein